ncbi:MAG: plasmid mobilization relaxosome protein MobC [Blautia sp.]|uniref:plasmid mobilization protein n=1 Tax=Blautia sp. TaxID=1955243 RepID=UPI002A75E8ED|nr:plasmid mobilization relaxosome protein MobC [Blautia sp.]MDY3017027.1 plasmid mobilization relaxosome protein MobC [Blautia sp.]
MARPKKEKELKHHHQIMLRLTDIEYELISTNAQNAQLPLAEYARKQLMNKKVIVKYEIVADLPEIKKLIAEFGKIGSNLNQIARYFNFGGIHSQEMRKEINQCIADIYEMKYKVLKMTGDFTAFSSLAPNHSKENSHGNTKTHSK